MMAGLRILMVLIILIFAAFNISAQTIGLENLNGPNVYFKTYSDFLKGTGVPYEKVSFNPTYVNKEKIFHVTFTTGKEKTTFGDSAIWGYRSENSIYRIIYGKYNVLCVGAIGDMILYSLSSVCFDQSIGYFICNGMKQFFVSQNLNSPIYFNFSELKPVYNGRYSAFFDCGSKQFIEECYSTFMNIEYEILPVSPKNYRKVNYQKVNHQVNHETPHPPQQAH